MNRPVDLGCLLLLLCVLAAACGSKRGSPEAPDREPSSAAVPSPEGPPPSSPPATSDPPRSEAATRMVELEPFEMGSTIPEAQAACEGVGGTFARAQRAIRECGVEVEGRAITLAVIPTPGTDRVGRMVRATHGPSPQALSPLFRSTLAQLTDAYGEPGVGDAQPARCADLTPIERCLDEGVSRLQLVWRRRDPGASSSPEGDQARLREAGLEDVALTLGEDSDEDRYYVVVELQAEGYNAGWGL